MHYGRSFVLTDLWLFTFTDPEFHLSSARVTATNKAMARSVIEAALGKPLPTTGVILAFLGKVNAPSERVASVITRAGLTIENDEAPI
jgi:hypothetical protein